MVYIMFLGLLKWFIVSVIVTAIVVFLGHKIEVLCHEKVTISIREKINIAILKILDFIVGAGVVLAILYLCAMILAESGKGY